MLNNQNFTSHQVVRPRLTLDSQTEARGIRGRNSSILISAIPVENGVGPKEVFDENRSVAGSRKGGIKLSIEVRSYL